MLQLPRYRPSLQERRKVRVESISFLILISASRTIGPQLQEQETDQVKKGNNASSVRRKSWQFSGISIRRGENKQWNTDVLLGSMKCYKTFDSIKTNKVARQTTLHHQPFHEYNLRVEVNVICLHARFVSWSVWVPSIHLKRLYSWLCCRSCGCLGISHCLQSKDTKSERTLMKWKIYIIIKRELVLLWSSLQFKVH